MIHRFQNPLAVGLLLLVSPGLLAAREFTDKTGKLKIEGTVIAADEKEIVLKLDAPAKGRELLAVAIADLSDADQKWLQSEENQRALSPSDERNQWTLRNGLTVFGKIVDFVRRDLTLQRRRGKLFVNDRPFNTLPEIYQRMVPKIVAQFENQQFANSAAFDHWVLQQKANARTFTCEGVLLELENGEEYAIPFFFFEDAELRVLKPAWEQWLATHDVSDEEKAADAMRQHALYLQSQTSEYQSQQEMANIARLQLQMQAVAAGVVDMWEVYLYPPTGVFGYASSVVVMARNSDEATAMAVANNPGYVVGPVRKMAGRYRW